MAPEHAGATVPAGGRPAAAPDLNATGAPEGLPPTGAEPEGPGREARERDAAWRRGEARRQQVAAEAREHAGAREAPPGHVAPGVLRAAERAFPTLAENVRDYAIFLLDRDGIITYWGEGARLMKWWTPDEAVGAHLRILYVDGGSEDGTAEDHLADAARTGESVGEGRRVRSDGSTFWAGVTLTALREEDGTLLGFAKVTRDLTARRAADAALERAAEAERARTAAEAARAATSQFAAALSHEVRTPVNALLGYTELLAAEIEGPLTAGQRAYVERLRAGGQHLLGLVTEVLDLSRLDAEAATDRGADRAEAEGAVGRLGDVVATALALVEPQARARGLVLADEVSAQAAATSYQGDEARVRQVLVNLLGNAVKFAESKDGEPARVTVSAGTTAEPPGGVLLPGAGPWAYVRVEDTGPGIPEDQREIVFEPFVQVGGRHHTAGSAAGSAASGGAGLGLAISRRLARRMRGEVSVESVVGAGATFVLWLPVAPLATLRTGGA